MAVGTMENTAFLMVQTSFGSLKIPLPTGCHVRRIAGGGDDGLGDHLDHFDRRLLIGLPGKRVEKRTLLHRIIDHLLLVIRLGERRARRHRAGTGRALRGRPGSSGGRRQQNKSVIVSCYKAVLMGYAGSKFVFPSARTKPNHRNRLSKSTKTEIIGPQMHTTPLTIEKKNSCRFVILRVNSDF